MGIIIKLTCSTQTGKKAQMIKSAPKISKSLNELKKKKKKRVYKQTLRNT